MMSRDAFASSHAIQRWIEAATLARGFALYVLVSPAPLETRLAIAALADALALQPHDVRTLDAFPPELRSRSSSPVRARWRRCWPRWCGRTDRRGSSSCSSRR